MVSGNRAKMKALEPIRRITVGSKNLAKVQAVTNAVTRVWPTATVEAVAAPSGVRDQPLNHDEAIQGAVNRALFSRLELDADLGLGLEGTTADTAYGMFLCGWVAVVDRTFSCDHAVVPLDLIESTVSTHAGISIGCTGQMLLPSRVADAVRKGGELGPLMDQLTQQHNTKQKLGTNGILTNGLIQRADSFEQGILLTLARYITPYFYE